MRIVSDLINRAQCLSSVGRILSRIISNLCVPIVSDWTNRARCLSSVGRIRSKGFQGPRKAGTAQSQRREGRGRVAGINVFEHSYFYL